MLLALSLFGVVLSMVIIWRASDGFEAASGYIGRNLSDGVRGATINAIGSSLPELLATSVALLFYMNKDGYAFGVGTTAGSAIFNGAVIPGLVILMVMFSGIKKIYPSKKVILRDGLALLVAEAVLILILTKGMLYWHDGVILLGVYASYIALLFTTMRDSEGEEEDEEDNDGHYVSRLIPFLTLDLKEALYLGKPLNKWRAWLLLAVSTAVIGGSCWLLVEACYAMGAALGIKVYFVAVILAAAATSVPDTILSMKDAKSGNYDDAVSNALGSNIFDICVCLGLPLLIFTLFHGPIQIDLSDGSIAELRVLLFLLTGVAFLIYFIGKGMGIVKGIMLLGLYALFVGYIYMRATGNEVALEIGHGLQKIVSTLEGI